MHVINAAFKTEEEIIKNALEKALIRAKAKAKFNRRVRNRRRLFNK